MEEKGISQQREFCFLADSLCLFILKTAFIEILSKMKLIL